MKTKDSEKALDVIGHKLKIKDQIDAPFNEIKLKDEVVVMEEDPDEKPVAPYKLQYNFNNKDFGLNVIAGLNLGKAYKLINNESEEEEKDYESESKNSEIDEYNISPNAIRVKYKPTYKEGLDEEALDYRLAKIKEAKNAIIIVENIFTRVTTGNYKDVLPYKEQLKFIYNKLNDPILLKKIVALNIGAVEQEIMHYNDLNLMEKLGNMLGIPDKVVQNCSLEISVKDPMIKNGKNIIRIIGYNAQTNATVGIFNSMRRFADSTAGYDVYYNSTAKQNGMLVGETTVTENGKKVKKPCYFVCFGGMVEYDKKNIKRGETYALNKFWYKTGFEPYIIKGDQGFKVRLDFEDYAYPYKEKTDFSNLVSSVISDEIAKTFDNTLNDTKQVFKEYTDQINVSARREFNKLMQVEKQHKKSKITKGTSKKTNGGKEGL